MYKLKDLNKMSKDKVIENFLFIQNEYSDLVFRLNGLVNQIYGSSKYLNSLKSDYT